MDYLSLIDCATGGPRCDVTPLFFNPAAFAAVVADLAGRFERPPECVAGIDALGFILGAALAQHWQAAFAAVRKGGKLPGAADRESFVDYSEQLKWLELRAGLLRPGMRTVIADEWIETGAQARAAAALVERQGGIVAGIAAIHIDVNDRTRPLLAQYDCQALQFET